MKLRPHMVNVLAMRAELSEVPVASVYSWECRMVLVWCLIGSGPYPSRTSGILEGGSKERSMRVPPQVGQVTVWEGSREMSGKTRLKP